MSRTEQELRQELRKMKEYRETAPSWAIGAADDRIAELEKELKEITK